MSVVTAVAAGVVVAARHSFEPDHIAALSTLTEGDEDLPARVGASWGIGHSVVVLFAGLVFLLAGARPPEPIARVFEAAAGLALVYLGLQALRRVFADHVSRHTHATGNSPHNHVSVAGLDFGSTHTHLHGESVVVGLLHGFAGSGALVLLLAAAASTPFQGAVYLMVFSGTTVTGMAVASHLWSKLLHPGLDRYVRGLAGTASLVLGALIVSEILPILG